VLSDGQEKPETGGTADTGPAEATGPSTEAEAHEPASVESVDEPVAAPAAEVEAHEPAFVESVEEPVAAPSDVEETSDRAETAETAPAPGTPAEPESAEPTTESPAADAADATREGEPDEKQAKRETPARRKPRFPALVRAFRSQRPVEGKVVQVVKGGYEIRVGRARGFCPHSQIELHREDEPERQIDKTYLFKITQLRRGGEDIVLSRRAVLEEQRVDEGKAVRATLIEGAVMQGHVVGTAPFGAFVDLGAGVLGLAHISELSHKRIQSVDEAVQVGDTVRVRVLKLKESGRISLSIRRAEDDPWADVQSKFEVGKVYPGKVQRLADFGAFVELAPGVEALAPASEFPPSSAGWKEGLEVGAEGQWHVLSVDPKARRVSVTPPGEAASAEPIAVGMELTGQVQRIERYGVFVWLGPGRVGLMPRALTGARESTDLRRDFRIGDRIEVSVVEIEEDGRRIRLARKGVEVEPEEPRVQTRPPRAESAPEEPAPSFGTSLGEKLRAALGQKDEES
jgi:small subunit ribosomal protein S1